MGKFDLVTCYSALHHLPDYVTALRSLSVFLKKGGVLYIDHEAPPFYWKAEPSSLASFVKDICFHSDPLFNSLYFQIIGLKVPIIDYFLVELLAQKRSRVDHKSIGQVFKEENYRCSRRTDHYLSARWIWNTLSFVYPLICRPEMSFWIAKK